jgi:hypothetical protein
VVFTVNDHDSGPFQCQIYINKAATGTGCPPKYTITSLNYATTYDVYVHVSNVYGGHDSNHVQLQTGPDPAIEPTLTVIKGQPVTTSACSDPSCGYIHVALSNFAAAKQFTIELYGRVCNGTSGQIGAYNIATNAGGSWEGDTTTTFGCSGQEVFAKVDDVKSQPYRWP